MHKTFTDRHIDHAFIVLNGFGFGCPFSISHEILLAVKSEANACINNNFSCSVVKLVND